MALYHSEKFSLKGLLIKKFLSWLRFFNVLINVSLVNYTCLFTFPPESYALKWNFKNKNGINGRGDNIRDVNKFLEDDKVDGRVATNSTEQRNLYPKI